MKPLEMTSMKTSAFVALALAIAVPFAAFAQTPAPQAPRPAVQAPAPAQQKVDCAKAENKAHADCKVSTTR
jgi:hypothetical protein